MKSRGAAFDETEGRSVASPLSRLSELREAVVSQIQAGRYPDAQLCCEQALALDASDAESMHLMGLVCLHAGRYDDVVQWISRALTRDPKPKYLTTLGAALLKLGRRDEAFRAFDKAVELKPDDAELWWHMANALVEAGRSAEALLCFRHVITLNPDHGDAAFKTGHLLYGLGEFEEALVRLNRSAELQPDHAPTFHMRALVLKSLRRPQEALADNFRAIELDPSSADTYGNVGNILQALDRHEEALSWYDRSLQVLPDVARTITNKAVSLAELGRLDEAMAAYRRSVLIDPGQAVAAWNLSLLQMLTGDFKSGWQGREARWRIPELAAGYPQLSAPMWLGKENIADKTIVVCADEGLGDTIQFVRYVPMLAQRGARVILIVEEALCPLLSGMAGVAQCLPKLPDTVLPPFDFHCPIASLPLAFKTRAGNIPAAKSYLPAPGADKAETWESRLGPRERLRVGLVWSGNPKHGNDRNRSIPLQTLTRILDVEDAIFVSLQKDPRPGDLAILSERTDIIDLTSDLTDFAETAALIACLDLVITVDTSVAHLAAALGRPTWVLLPFVPDYRWLLDRDDSPWYPTVRLFRQTATRDYGPVLDRVRTELSKVLQNERPARTNVGAL